MAWHRSSCTSINLIWEGERPGCRRCGAWARPFSVADAVPPPPPPPDTKRLQLICTWPPVVQYDKSEVEEDLLVSIDEDVDFSATHDRHRDKGQTRPRSESESSAFDHYTRVVYERLPDRGTIRLLRLHGSTSYESPIHCSLETGHLDDPCLPTFEAVSYTWADHNGDARLRDQVFMGHHWYPLPVTRNCVSALRRFRTTHDRLLWIDAICINQTDLLERSKQVSMMYRIYFCAARVLIYLGEDRMMNDPGADHFYALATQSKPTSCRKPLSMLVRPYFRRLWVVQEVKAARKATITCGTHTVSWADYQASIGPHHDDLAPWIRKDFQTLLSALLATRSCSCGDPRDKVFAIFGLLPKPVKRELPIDYKLSVQQVYTGIASYLIQGNYVNFHILTQLATGPKSIRHLPSWVPDWTALPPIDGPAFVRCEVKIPPLPKAKSPNGSHGDWRSVTRESASTYLPPGGELRISRRGGLLIVSAVRIFSIDKSHLCLTGIADNTLQLPYALDIPCPLELIEGRTLDCFYVPCLGLSVLLKRHAEHTYTLLRTCSLRFAGLGKETLVTNSVLSGKLLDGIQGWEFDLILRWVLDVFYIGVRTNSCLALLDQENCYQLWATHLKRLVEVCATPAMDRAKYLGKKDFEVMVSLREEILGVISQEDLSALKTLPRNYNRCPHSRCRYWRGELLGGSIVADLRDLREACCQHSQSPKALVQQWREEVTALKQKLAGFPNILTVLQELVPGTFQPSCHMRAYGVPQAKNGEFDILVRFCMDGVDPNQDTIDAPELIHQIWKFIGNLHLDFDKPWSWNCDRFSILLSTLKFLVRFQGSLLLRRILCRFDHARRNLERIIIA